MLRSREAYAAAAFDWSILDGCFGPTKIRATDLDGCVEHRGQVLVLEAKPGDKAVPAGQCILFDTLVRKGMTVIVLWHNHGQVRAVQRWPEPKQHGDGQVLRAMVETWYTEAHR